MTKEEIGEIKAALLAEKKRIEDDLKSLGNYRMSKDRETIDEASDEVEEFFEQAGEISVLKRRLGGIEEALSKIEKGRYGICENCHGEISLELLKVDPESRFCKDCKAGIK